MARRKATKQATELMTV